MKQYSFFQEFDNCAAGITGYESLPTVKKDKLITSKPVDSFLKPVPKDRGNQTMRSKVYKKEKSLA